MTPNAIFLSKEQRLEAKNETEILNKMRHSYKKAVRRNHNSGRNAKNGVFFNKIKRHTFKNVGCNNQNKGGSMFSGVFFAYPLKDSDTNIYENIDCDNTNKGGNSNNGVFYAGVKITTNANSLSEEPRLEAKNKTVIFIKNVGNVTFENIGTGNTNYGGIVYNGVIFKRHTYKNFGKRNDNSGGTNRNGVFGVGSGSDYVDKSEGGGS